MYGSGVRVPHGLPSRKPFSIKPQRAFRPMFTRVSCMSPFLPGVRFWLVPSFAVLPIRPRQMVAIWKHVPRKNVSGFGGRVVYGCVRVRNGGPEACRRPSRARECGNFYRGILYPSSVSPLARAGQVQPHRTPQDAPGPRDVSAQGPRPQRVRTGQRRRQAWKGGGHFDRSPSYRSAMLCIRRNSAGVASARATAARASRVRRRISSFTTSKSSRAASGSRASSRIALRVRCDIAGMLLSARCAVFRAGQLRQESAALGSVVQ